MNKILLLIILLITSVEAKKGICKNKDENYYTKEQLQAYYIREKKVKQIEKKCNQGEEESCRILALEKIYNFHPCESEHEKRVHDGDNLLLDLCHKNNAKACYTYAYYNSKRRYFLEYEKMACKLDPKYCIKKDKIDPFNSSLSRYKQIEKELKKLDILCINNKDGEACFALSYYYNYEDMFQPYFALVEQNQTKARYYQHYSCLYSFYDISCRIRGDGGYGKPVLWIKERASTIDFSFFKIFGGYLKDINYTPTSRAIVRYTDLEKGQVWQIGADKKLYQSHIVREMYREKCIDCIPKDGNWRLATKKEILSIIDLFEKEKQDFQYYWTAEQSNEDPMDYWVVDVKHGTTYEVYKNNHYDKGCVYVRDLN